MLVYTGKRGIVYCFYPFAIKVKRKDSLAVNRILHEGKWLKLLNKYGIGPHLYIATEKFLLLELIRGETILEFFTHASKKEKWKVVMEILRQCRILDELHIDKFEMHHPVKHVFLTKRRKAVMIDFERCKYSLKPKNVTQFVQFLPRLGILSNKERMKQLLQEYKKNYSEKRFREIISILK